MHNVLQRSTMLKKKTENRRILTEIQFGISQFAQQILKLVLCQLTHYNPTEKSKDFCGRQNTKTCPYCLHFVASS